MPTKRVPDTDQRIHVAGDGKSIDTAQIPFVINPFDAIALEEAVRIRESGDREVDIVAIGIGESDYESELRTALAMGADRAVLIECTQPLDPWNVSRILKAIVEREHPELVLMGKQAVDDDANQVGQFLAALLDWPQATFASQMELVEDAVRVHRETDTGVETVRVLLPAVITTDLRLNEPRYASLPSILRAKKKPIERIAFEHLGLTLEPRIEWIGLESISTGRICAMLDSVDELLDRLRDEVKVI